MMSNNKNAVKRETEVATQHIFDFYKRPGEMTSGGKYTVILENLPNDVGELAHIVQGLIIHEYVASDFYGFTVPDDRKSESHIRRVEQMLDSIFALDDQPIIVARPPEKRLVGVCHHFARLLIAMLRAKGVAARARLGFGSYFNPGFFEDHVVCEYWNASKERWILVDPQFDEVWRTKLKINHDVLDVPRDRFLIAVDAWAKCRNGQADPSKFGIFKGDLRGLWFIAGSLVRDVAALNKMEMLQWDTWGVMPNPNEQLDNDQLAYFDRLATLTHKPDASFEELCRLYETDDRVRVPEVVFNPMLKREEAI